MPAPLAPNPMLCVQSCPVGPVSAQQNPQWEGFPLPSLPLAAAEGSACSVPASRGLASEGGGREIGCRTASVCPLSAVPALQGDCSQVVHCSRHLPSTACQVWQRPGIALLPAPNGAGDAFWSPSSPVSCCSGMTASCPSKGPPLPSLWFFQATLVSVFLSARSCWQWGGCAAGSPSSTMPCTELRQAGMCPGLAAAPGLRLFAASGALPLARGCFALLIDLRSCYLLAWGW